MPPDAPACGLPTLSPVTRWGATAPSPVPRPEASANLPHGCAGQAGLTQSHWEPGAAINRHFINNEQVLAEGGQVCCEVPVPGRKVRWPPECGMGRQQVLGWE